MCGGHRWLVLNIVCHKSSTIVKVLESSWSNVMFERDLVCRRLASWNVLMQHLASVLLMQGIDEFRWNLYENGKLHVDSTYRVLTELPVPALLSTSFSVTAIFQDRGVRHILVYVDDFPAARYFYKRLGFFQAFSDTSFPMPNSQRPRGGIKICSRCALEGCRRKMVLNFPELVFYFFFVRMFL
jgi:hypothetical protein